MILVTGATGNLGSAVCNELVARGVGGVRGMVRSAGDRGRVPAGVEPVEADYADPQSLDRALRGIDAAYLVCAAVPQLVDLETQFLSACKRAGTRHVVLQSAIGAGKFPKSFPSWHRRVEQNAAELKVPHTVLRANGFMQNVPTYFAPTVRTQDAFYDALGDSRIGYIDVRDIAAAAAEALRSGELSGRVFELSGPESLTHHDLAGRISKVAGRPIRYVPLTPEQMLQGLTGSGMPAGAAQPVVELYEYYRAGGGVGSDADLRSLIRREPRRIDAYLAEIAPQFARG